VTSARLTIFKTLASGTSTELILITPRTSSTETLAKQTLAPNKNETEAKFKESWRKTQLQEQRWKRGKRRTHLFAPIAQPLLSERLFK